MIQGISIQHYQKSLIPLGISKLTRSDENVQSGLFEPIFLQFNSPSGKWKRKSLKK
jgi:hypothetical protein